MDSAALRVALASTDDLGPTDNLFQSRLWAHFRMRTGASVHVVRLGAPNARMMVQLEHQGDFTIAYVAAGPDVCVPQDGQGLFLEELSEQLRPQLSAEPLAVRYDLPWDSPYDDPAERPSARVREIRMNFGTRRHRLHKAATDRLAPDSVEVRIDRDESDLLAEMRPKTRYNVRLARRRGVTVTRADADLLPLWHELYEETASRKGFRPQTLEYFRSLFDLAQDHRPDIRLYLAYGGSAQGRGNVRSACGPGVLGGIVVAHVGAVATYLYGASAAERRDLMAPYALQWHAMRDARNAGCSVYDLFGVPPAADEGHPMYGLYRFKTGFGGTLVHRRGAWDYVYNPEVYGVYEAAEATGRGYYV